MLKAISKYGLAAHLALAAALPAALSPFCTEHALIRITFLVVALAAVWTFAEPSILAGEDIVRARRRVLSSVLRSPVFWTMLIVCLMAFMRFYNDGVTSVFNPEKLAWSVSDGTFALLPGSVPQKGTLPLALSCSALIVVIGLLYAAGRAARVWFAIAASTIAGVSGFAACAMALLEDAAFLTAATAGFGTLRFLGVYYGLFLLVSVSGGICGEEFRWRSSRPLFGISLGGCAAGTLFFLPTLLALPFLALGAVFTVFAFFRLRRRCGFACTARSGIMLFFGVFIAALPFTVPTAAKVVTAKTDGISLAKAQPENAGALDAVYRSTALEMWGKRPWCGVGIGAYRVQIPFVAPKDAWETLPTDVEIPTNGYLGLLSERGILGCLSVAGVFLALLITWVFRLVDAFRLNAKDREGDIFVFSAPLGGWTWLGVLPLFGVALFSAVFTQPAAWLAAVSVCAFAAASFPRVKVYEEKNGD